MKNLCVRIIAAILMIATLTPLLTSCANTEYTVDFMVDGELYQSVSAKKPDDLALPENPEKSGFTFIGWYYDDGIWQNSFDISDLKKETKEKKIRLTVYALFKKGENGMENTYYFDIRENNSVQTTILSFASDDTVNRNPSIADRIDSVDGTSVFKWTANRAVALSLQSETDLSGYTTINMRVYSEKATGKSYQIRFNCAPDMQGTNSMIPYFRYNFTLDFTGWKTFEINMDECSGNYGPVWNRICSVNLDCSGWGLTPDENTVVHFTDLVAIKREYDLVLPQDVTDASLPEYYDCITAKYRELLVGSPEGSSSAEYMSAAKAIENRCKSKWDQFKATYNGGAENSLFGYTITFGNKGDESKITSIYGNLLDMAKGYGTKGSAYYKNEELLEDIKLGLEYCYKYYYGPTVISKGTYGNWWQWDIGSPLSLTGILTILENELGVELCKKYLTAFDYLNPLPSMTACNKIWITRCIILSAALQHDGLRIALSNKMTYDVFDYVTSSDGFYTDGSFVQHGNLSYTGGYGLSMINELTNIMYFMNGSRFDWVDDNVNNQYTWVFENFRPCVYDGNFMAAMRGREVSRNTSESSAQHTFVTSLIKMQAYAPDDIKPRLESLIRHYMLSTGKNYASSVPPCLIDYSVSLSQNASIAPANDYFVTKVLAKMDRVVHHGPEYGVCISLSSTRIYKYESINQENRTGWYQGEGMIYIYTDGYDYSKDFFLYADPYRMPGVTNNLATRVAVCPNPHPFNSSAFAGGVSGGKYGVSGFILGYNVEKVGTGASASTFYNDRDAKISARKSYFMFDNEIVCLGSGISDVSGKSVITTVENRLIKPGDVFSVNGVAVTPSATETTVNDAKTMHFTNMGGYVFFKTDVDGNDITYSKATNTKSFLQITLNHGVGNTNLNGKYAYVYLPEATASETESYNADPDVEILYRKNAVHAVAEKKLGILGCVFFDADTTINNGSGVTAVTSVKATNACTMMIIAESDGSTTVCVSDPTQLQNQLSFTLGINASTVVHADDGVTVTLTDGQAKVMVNTLAHTGGTYTFNIK